MIVERKLSPEAAKCWALEPAASSSCLLKDCRLSPNSRIFVMGQVGFINQLIGSIVHQPVEIIDQSFGIFGNLNHFVVLNRYQAGRLGQAASRIVGNRIKAGQTLLIIFGHFIHVGGRIVGLHG